MDTLEAIIGQLSESYSGGLIERAFATHDPATLDEFHMKPELAAFLLRVIVTNYDSASSAEANLRRIHSVLEEVQFHLSVVVSANARLLGRTDPAREYLAELRGFAVLLESET